MKHLHAIGSKFYEHSHRNGKGWEQGYPNHRHPQAIVNRLLPRPDAAIQEVQP